MMVAMCFMGFDGSAPTLTPQAAARFGAETHARMKLGIDGGGVSTWRQLGRVSARDEQVSGDVCNSISLSFSAE